MVRTSFLVSFAVLCGVVGCSSESKDGGSSDTETSTDPSTDGTTDEPGTGSTGSTGGATDGPTTGGTTGTTDPGVDLPDGCDAFVSPGDDDQTALQGALLDAAPGSTVCLDEGTFMFNTEVSVSADGITLLGAGRDRTILDFSLQDLGGNGIKVSGDDVTLKSFTVQETPGDGIRGDSVKNIVYDDIAVIWAAEASVENGAYGFYPVGCEGVVIRNSIVRGARDAGIYVGQSVDILVEDNEAVGNVAGIEIENSTDATVRRNHAHDNTAGILIFNLPGLEVKDGKRTLAYENTLENNNVPNFGEPGTIVSEVPYGLGLMILASDANEVRDNDIRGNKSVGVLIAEYSSMLFEPFDDPSYNIFAEGNYVHGNRFEGNATDPDILILTITSQAKPGYDMLLDGCVDDMADNGDGSLTNCFDANGDATYLNFDLCNGFADQSTDIAPQTCQHDELPAPN